MAEVVEFAKPEAQAFAPYGFIMTGCAQNILRTLHLVRSKGGGEVALISATPGAGKTEAVWHFKNENREKVFMHVAIAREDDTPWGVACQLMEMLEIGQPNNRDMRGSRQRISEAIGVDNILIVDEAQNLIRHNLRGGTDWLVAANTRIFAGALIMRTETGFLAPGDEMTGAIGVGRADIGADNTGGADGAIAVDWRKGTFRFENSAGTDLITLADIGQHCFIANDCTVAKTDGGATRSPAGVVEDVDDAGVWVLMDEALTRALA